ncbi:DVUA0089 family protein, partial [Planctomycetota bacterium]
TTAGGGGGGRIALYYAYLSGFDTDNQIQANGGIGYENGGEGTIYLEEVDAGDTIPTAADPPKHIGMEGLLFHVDGVGNNIYHENDVDFVVFKLVDNSEVWIDVDAAEVGSSLDSYLRLFDSDGNELATSDDDAAVGEPSTSDSYIYKYLNAGTYYVGVSAYPNSNYLPFEADSAQLSGNSDHLGTYMLTIFSGAVDSVPPEPVVDLTFADDTGYSSTDHITVDSEVVFSWTEPYDDSGIAMYEYRWDGSEWVSIKSASVILSAGEGEHDFEVRAIDNGNNVGEATNLALVVDLTAPQVIDHAPDGVIHTLVDYMDVTFSEPVNLDIFIPDKITIIGPTGVIPDAVTGINHLSGNTYRISLKEQISAGSFKVYIDSSVEDVAGNLMAIDYFWSFEPKQRDLTIPYISVDPAANVKTGDELTVSWHIENSGIGAVDLGFYELVRVVNTTTGQELLTELLPFDPGLDGVIIGGGTVNRYYTFKMPDGDISVGDIEIIVTTDFNNNIFEYNVDGDAESNNTAIAIVASELAPYPDLLVTYIEAPTIAIGDPAKVTVTWTVENQGNGPTVSGSWFDAIIASVNDTFGDSDDFVLARFEYFGLLGVNGSYARNETFLLPPAFPANRYNLFFKADFDDTVFENVLESNNVTRADEFFDAMPIPYADLIVTSVLPPSGDAFSGQPFNIKWEVKNQGIGISDKASWSDFVYLAANPDGSHNVQSFGWFDHLGHLAVEGTYTRNAAVVPKDGLEGEYYIVVRTGGPFEFLYTDNNSAVSAAFPISLTPPPDLIVTGITAPVVAEEGSVIDVDWTVENQGEGEAPGSWTDKIYLQKAGDPNASKIQLGNFTYNGPLQAGMTYKRREQFRLPIHFDGQYEVVVTTNYNNTLYEHGETVNNTLVDDNPVNITIKPRSDLQVSSITVPTEVDAGGTFAVEFEIINQGTAVTNVPHWVDRVYLSFDGILSNDDIRIDTVSNPYALEPGVSYNSETKSIIIPNRYGGEIYVLVHTDADNQMDEWPNDTNNISSSDVYAEPIIIIPVPKADLVIDHQQIEGDEVVAPTQSIIGAEIEVRYTVTNLGTGATNINIWTDMIWLARDKNRPHAGAGDILLKTISHTGVLDVSAGYDVITNVTIPDGLISGTYYITPWTDPYGIVLEDTLANNVNPDDPHEIDNNNYKARAIAIIGVDPKPDPKPKPDPIIPPDLVVQSVVCDEMAEGGGPFTVSWTVTNQGAGETRKGWSDRLYLATKLPIDPLMDPAVNPLHPFVPGTNLLHLGDFGHNLQLKPDESHTKTQTFTLTPSAVGIYVVVIADIGNNIPEANENVDAERNNILARETDITPARDLK